MPSKHRYVTLDVFTSATFGGNQLAVFPDASAIPEEELIRITREFNFSETTFCYPPSNPAHTKRVRIFTPGKEVPFAGHPTVGTAIALRLLGEGGAAGGEARLVLEEGVGPVTVTVRTGGTWNGAPFAQFAVAKLPEIGPPPPSRGMLAEILSIEKEDIQAAPMTPQNVGTLAWTVDQGVEMGRPSRLEIEADKSAGAITAIRVGGNAVLASEGTFLL